MLGRNPLNFEPRVVLQGLRQKQHRWGAAWGIQKRFSQRFCIETVLTQKSSQGYCLEDVAILSQRKSSSTEQPSYRLDFQQLRHIPSPPYVQAAFPIESTRLVQLSPNPGQSIRTFSQAVPKRCSGRLMSGSVQAADDKMAVMPVMLG